MPYKNKSDHFYPPITVTFLKSEPALYAALKQATQGKDIPLTEYLRNATREKLIRDKYLSPDDK